jgi:hypothetical protein
MSEKKNVVASVLARLRNTSKSSGAPFQQVLQQYAMERFLYRISKSKHAQSVILKGALLLKTIGIPRARPTMDIDMLRKGKADQASLLALARDTTSFVAGHRVQWKAFVKKIGEDELADAFGKIVADLKTFATPLLRSVARGAPIAERWKAGMGWIAH